VTPDAWADFCEDWVRCRTCGTPSPPQPTPDACVEWALSHVCPPVTAEQAALNAALLDAEVEATERTEAA
jgi:hypothetical protein